MTVRSSKTAGVLRAGFPSRSASAPPVARAGYGAGTYPNPLGGTRNGKPFQKVGADHRDESPRISQDPAKAQEAYRNSLKAQTVFRSRRGPGQILNERLAVKSFLRVPRLSYPPDGCGILALTPSRTSPPRPLHFPPAHPPPVPLPSP